jgi:endonuclease YncB( thermonuclease family)
MKTEGFGGIQFPMAAKADAAPKTAPKAAPKTKKPVKAKPAEGDKLEVAAKKKPEHKAIRTVVYPPLSEPWKAPTKGTVLTEEKSVYDGDTFKIAGYSVRVGEVNAPERRPAQAGWEEAQKALEKLVKGKDVTLDYGAKKDPRDGYGRLVARVSVGGKLVPEALLEQGVVHCYFIQEAGDTYDRSALVAAQERAKAKGLGIWSQDRFKKDFVITSFHPNGRGNDAWNPNVEYLRICNVSSKPMNIGGYTITNASGLKWTLPDVTVPVGHTVQIFSGRGENDLSPPKAIKIHLQSKTPIWDNYLDKMTMRDPKGAVVVEQAQNQDPPNMEKLASELTITQKQIGRLGSDVEVSFTGPDKIIVKDYTPEDGDTFYIPQPKTGTFKAHIDKWSWDLALSDNDQAPSKGVTGIRFFGVDTPETSVVKVLDTGEMVHASQGLIGERAKDATNKMLAKADKIWVKPAGARPFDVYDRLLGIVMLSVGGKTVELNKWLVEQGYGEMVSYYGKDFDPAHHEDYAKAAKVAFEEKRGIYADGETKQHERPSEFRRRMADRPPSTDYVADWETKLVYPVSAIDMVPPYRRVMILHDDLSPALLDERFGFKLSNVRAPEEVSTQTAAAAPTVRAMDLQVRERSGRKST